MNIKNELLIGIIQEYIKNKEPIGSEVLKSRQNFEVSSATIRNYFKILEKEGALFQPHISSGRIPTNSTLHSYWKKILNVLVKENLHIDSKCIKSLSACYEIYCVTIPKTNNILHEVIDCGNGYLILKFSRNEAVINFSEALLRFLESFKNMDIQDIIKIANEVGAGELKRKLLALEQVDFEQTSLRYGSEFLKDILYKDVAKFNEIFQARVLLRYQNGIYFDKFLPNGYMAIIHDASYLDRHLCKNKQVRMMSIGSIHADFKSFYAELGFTNFA
ncbi:heat-inducible transcription repressor [Helicobacter didelphidarum]|uniref:Heat-inducible transcription repressor n=1 Tax=Helicobacter didelphidarum TaxID=2040648 RepID=A0A3D8IMK8_9HELI|nr:heat-inducible transcription repressor [Helicobacter didelphidarum]RDU65811.1 heat-inducible transcription repressor [Helicobacter didelphidarum]